MYSYKWMVEKLLLVLVATLLMAKAEPAWAWIQSIEAKHVKALEVHGFHGDILFKGEPNAKFFRIQVIGVREVIGSGEKFLENSSPNSVWRLFVEKKSLLKLTVRGPDVKGVWWDMVQNRNLRGKVRIVIQGPPKKLKLSWLSGIVDIKNWIAETHVSLKSGRLTVEKSAGFFKSSVMKGHLSVRQHKGDLHLDTYSASVNSLDVEGNINVQNFSGPSFIKNATGTLHFSSYSGALTVKGGEGQVNFESHSGAILANQFEGRLEGKSGEGKITLNVTQKPDIRVHSTSGLVKVNLPKSSGAWVNVGTNEGDLYVPSEISTKRFPNLKIARGRLSGLSKGSVYVRTQSGRVIVR